MVSQNSGERLDVASGSTADGATVIQYTCGSGTDQQWTRTES
nr:RICIN domain-containing protein [Microbispora sp. CL1-1]